MLLESLTIPLIRKKKQKESTFVADPVGYKGGLSNVTK